MPKSAKETVTKTEIVEAHAQTSLARTINPLEFRVQGFPIPGP